jgi:hypothetical protein
MTPKPPGSRYTAVAVFLHGIMALGILALAVIGRVRGHAKTPLSRDLQALSIS